MPETNPGVIDAIRDRMQRLKDQLGLVHAIRDVAFDTTAYHPYSAAAIREIRRLYEEFDAKHPPQDKAVES